MLDMNAFILIAVGGSIILVGILAWLVDSGLGEKEKKLVKAGLFALIASILGLFFLIEDDSEFEYGGWTPQEKKKSERGGGMGGNGGGGGEAAMSGGGGGGGGIDSATMSDEGGGGTKVGDDNSAEEESGAAEDEEEGKEEEEKADGTKQDCPVCPVIVMIQPGQALVGSSNKALTKGGRAASESQATFKREFGIGKFEVTVEQYKAFTTETGYKPQSACRVGPKKAKKGSFKKPGFKQSSSHPAVCVSFVDAMAFTEWLSAKTGHVYRLPTELEWEYAARAGVTSGYLSPGPITSVFANFTDKKGQRVGSTTPVGSYSANGNGMHDVHGNAWEMTADCWSASYLTLKGSGKPRKVDCSRHVAKGGGWYSKAPHLNLSMRVGVKSDFANNGLGFRVVRESGAPTKRKSSSASNGFMGGETSAGTIGSTAKGVQR